MDELEISGRRYISSVRAAKEHKYHSDYIGQLVRGGKVVGQKVGRAWYVDADSLAEYLGKEVPARGPVVKKAEVETEAVKEEEPYKNDIKVEIASEEFVMPLRKSGRLHVIAAMGEAPGEKKLEEDPKETKIENAAEENIPVFVAEEPIEIFVMEEPKSVMVEEEETFIPLKISNTSVHNIYAEPEDSFYRVSRKGLQYVRPGEHDGYQEKPVASTQHHASASKKIRGGKMLVAVGSVFGAGIVALTAGVLMSYYLHSVTTVGDAGQTSSVILSN